MNQSKTASVITVIASLLTGLTLALNLSGRGAFLELLFVGAFALLGWLVCSFRNPPDPRPHVLSYIAIIVLILCLDTARYASDFAGHLELHFPALFPAGFPAETRFWLFGSVSLPVSALLLGGFFLIRRRPAGYFFAWAAALFAIAEAVIQFFVELGDPRGYEHHYYLGTLAAMALFVLGVNLTLRLLLPQRDDQGGSEVKALSPRLVTIWSLFFLTGMLLYAVTVFVEAGPLPVLVIVGSMMGGLLGWRRTTARKPADPFVLVPLYLLLLALFYVHVGEEILGNFSQALGELTRKAWDGAQFNYLIVFLGPIAWIYAAYSLWKGRAYGNFILWFMIVGMILGEPTHLVLFPVIRMLREGGGYGYFPGMYTALFPMIPAILALLFILKSRPAKTGAPNRG